ncbi:MAG: DNA-protecting protein DprA [Comamonadaceae bacterium]|nr:DNA-protecting protein DprA [Comamonadaceae bacterium]
MPRCAADGDDDSPPGCGCCAPRASAATRARRLLAAFGSPRGGLRRRASGPARAGRRRALRRRPLRPPAAGLDERGWPRARPGWPAAPRARVLTLGDAALPAALLQTADPPLLLYVAGPRRAAGARPSMAIVGSRNPTPQGADNARAFASALGASRAASSSPAWPLGIDGAAHEGALAGRRRRRSPSSAPGSDRVYPRAPPRRWRSASPRRALLVSEYAPGTPPLAPNFPQRNRIIAGLSRGTLVVEAALQSGSLITARLAAEAGREVFAIPGSIHSPQSRGCHALIKQGAKLVESAARHPRGTARRAPAAAGAGATPRRARRRRRPAARRRWATTR